MEIYNLTKPMHVYKTCQLIVVLLFKISFLYLYLTDILYAEERL